MYLFQVFKGKYEIDKSAKHAQCSAVLYTAKPFTAASRLAASAP